MCNGAHHYVCLLRLNSERVVEVLTLDSMWNGGMKLHEFKRTGFLVDNGQYEVFKTLEDQAEKMVVHDGYLRYLFAVLAQMFWPEDMTKPRRVVQKFPLVPHQGATNNCGVYTFYFLASLYLHPASFLRAFEPGNRLVVSESFGMDHRNLLLYSALDAVNAYDGSLDEFFGRIRHMQSQIRVYVVN